MNEEYVTKQELIEQLEMLRDLNRKLFRALEEISAKNLFFEERLFEEKLGATC